MTFQGHILNGMVVFDERVPLAEGALVRVEPVPLPKVQPEPIRPLIADTDQPHTVQQMALAWKNITREIPVDNVALPVDPDDYPLF